MRIKQSLCYPCFRPKDMSLDELFRTVAGIGYAAVELWGRGDDFEELVTLAHKHGLAVASMCGHGSLPDGLNMGAQLHRLETLHPGLLGDGATLLPWAQYWAWRLSGVAASEVTSLGCHSDLWRPLEGRPSSLARKRGWAGGLAPLRSADAILGKLTPEWVGRTGLPADVSILCGLHDSNAALLAARGFPEIADADATVLSTGTWFVAMRSPGPGQPVDMNRLDEARDCLVNVDAYGRPVPSARFMGGREIEILTGLDTRRIDIGADQPRLIGAAPAALQGGAMVLPTLTPGVGPFPHGRGRWIGAPADEVHRRVLVSLYAALVSDAALDLIGARGRLLVEGRFAEADVFVRALAALRPETAVYTSNADNDVSYGALRLLNPRLAPKSRAMLRLISCGLCAARGLPQPGQCCWPALANSRRR